MKSGVLPDDFLYGVAGQGFECFVGEYDAVVHVGEHYGLGDTGQQRVREIGLGAGYPVATNNAKTNRPVPHLRTDKATHRRSNA